MKRVLYILVLFSSATAYSQQTPMYSQFLFHDYLVNPAIVGTRDYYDAKFTSRLQWSGIEDAPRTLVLSGQGPLKNRKMGLGAYAMNDRAGHIYQQSGYLTYSYILKMNDGMRLSFGLSAGITSWSLDGSKLNLNDNGDQVLSSGVQTATVPDGSFGVLLKSKRLDLGISVTQLFQSRLVFFENGNEGTARLEPHLNLHTSYDIGSEESEWHFIPYILIKGSNPSQVQIDLGMKAEFKKLIWIGASYRSGEAFSGLLGLTFRDNISFGYSYDFVTSEIASQTTGSHEIMLGIKLQRSLPKKD